MALTFGDVTALSPIDDGRFGGDVSADWTIGGKPNGGYLLAMLGRAATTTGPHRHVIAASAHYLRSPDPGPVTIVANTLRAGRSASQVRTQLHQDGQLCVEALLTTSELDSNASPHWDGGASKPSGAAFADAVPLLGPSPDGRRVAILDQIEVRLDPASLGFTRGQPSGRGELRGWLSLPGGEPFDPTSLLFAVDAFPPATFEVEFTGW